MRCPLCDSRIDTTVVSPEVAKPLYRPFCSERCKTIDLAQWLTGGYAVPGEPVEVNHDPGFLGDTSELGEA